MSMSINTGRYAQYQISHHEAIPGPEAVGAHRSVPDRVAISRCDIVAGTSLGQGRRRSDIVATVSCLPEGVILEIHTAKTVIDGPS